VPASGRRSVRAEVPPTQRQHVLRRGANCHSGSECRWMAPRTRVERAVDIAVDNFVDYLKPWGTRVEAEPNLVGGLSPGRLPCALGSLECFT